MDVRCDYKKHGELYPEEELLEIKCNSRLCGAGPGVVVIHGFDVKTGKLLGTERFRDPIPAAARQKEGNRL